MRSINVVWGTIFVIALAFSNAGCGGCGNDGTAPDAEPIVDIDAELPCLEDGEGCSDSARCCSEACLDDVCVPPGNCTAAGDACTDTADCCAGSMCLDDGAGGLTCQAVGLCASDGDACSIDSECCSLNCPLGGPCGPASGACVVTGGDCTMDEDCCSFNCNGTTCDASAQNCDPIGEACTAGSNSCCSDFCADPSGEICDGADADCRCRLVTGCRPQGELCDADADCCNGYCDRPGGVTVGFCTTSLGSCEVVGEPCGNPGVNGACCSNACVDNGSGVATCEFLGGCLPLNEVCATDGECCGGSCVQNGTTADGRPIMRCADTTSCLNPGEVCMTGASSNCCPAGGGDTGCETATSGVDRCFGGDPGCVIPSNGCTTVADCCTDLGAIVCEPGPTGENICCLPDGESCAFGDTCCSGVCAPDSSGNLVCNPGGCVLTGNQCTTDSDCCEGCCMDDGTGTLTCTTECMGECTLGQLGEFCSATSPCCPGLTCAGSGEFRFCELQ